MKQHYQLIVVGGGPAGLGAALAAHAAGITEILIVERDKELGGILNQCIHNGFGLHRFQEELTGPEYAQRFIRQLQDTSIAVLTDAMVLEVTAQKEVRLVSSEVGYQTITADAVILAMGCRERTRGAISIPGSRPAGVLTAGAAQRYVNLEGQMVGKRVLILGSGDIGLIMARRMTLEGAEVLACVELQPYSGGLARNIHQCLHDFDIPLYLSHTITEIKGDTRVTRAVVSKVDENRRPIKGSEIFFDCDTILLSVGLIPENELSKKAGIPLDFRTRGPMVYEDMQTETEGIFACGNVVHVHDLVDFVTEESEKAGRGAAAYVLGGSQNGEVLAVEAEPMISYTVPQKIHPAQAGKGAEISFRVRKNYQECRIAVKSGETQLASFRRSHMAPGEMEKIKLPAVLLQKAKEKITVSVEEVTP